MKKIIHEWLQNVFTPTCLRCGSFFCTKALFCKTCLNQKIFTRVVKIKLTHLPHNEHHYLFYWKKSDPEYLSQLIYRLKGSQSPIAWEYFAKLFFETNKYKINFSEFDVLIPIPSSRAEPDHAKIFSNELAKLCGLKVVDALKKNSMKQQKKLNSKQRKNQSAIVVKERGFEQITRCLFVDDVLTTGQTYKSCKKTLPRLKKCAVISLFYRPKEA